MSEGRVDECTNYAAVDEVRDELTSFRNSASNDGRTCCSKCVLGEEAIKVGKSLQPIRSHLLRPIMK